MMNGYRRIDQNMEEDMQRNEDIYVNIDDHKVNYRTLAFLFVSLLYGVYLLYEYRYETRLFGVVIIIISSAFLYAHIKGRVMVHSQSPLEVMMRSVIYKVKDIIERRGR